MIPLKPKKNYMIALLIIASTISLSGCMSIRTLNENIDWRHATDELNCHRLNIKGTPPVVYSGAWADVRLMLAPVITYQTVEFPAFPLAMIIGVIDFAPSFILDTLALPYTIPYAVSLDCK